MSVVVDMMNRIAEISEVSIESSRNSSNIGEGVVEKLKKVIEEGDINKLYELIAEDGNVLDYSDNVSFCESPLHMAVKKGQTHMAMEIMALKPLLAFKLDESGMSPIHIALLKKDIGTVRGFVAMESSLVGIKGRGMMSPLHYVAQVGDTQLLSEFLFASPTSLEVLTTKCETAVHLAVKKKNLSAFKVLLGWIKRGNREEILEWKDEDGNTVLHIAALTNQPEVMKLLSKTAKIRAKNLEGKTAMELLQTHDDQSPQVRRLLNNVKEKLTCFSSTMTLADYLSKELSWIEKLNVMLGLSYLTMTKNESHNSSNRREDNLDQKAGQMVMPFSWSLVFTSLNGLAFLISVYVIVILTIGLPMWRLIYSSLAALGIAMSVALIFTLPPLPDDHSPEFSLQNVLLACSCVSAFPVVIGIMLITTSMAFFVDKNRRLRVDFKARHFSSSQELLQ